MFRKSSRRRKGDSRIMIKLEHVVLVSPEQMKFIIEGMRNSINSWGKSDSVTCEYGWDCESCRHNNKLCNKFYLGHDDEKLMQKLSKSGTDYRKFMPMIPVYARITAPLYWWKEFDTYKVGTVANPCSMMHKIQEHILTTEDFSCEHLSPHSIQLLEEYIMEINKAILYFKQEKDMTDWWQIIQLLPSSYNQTQNVMMNYDVLTNIYKSYKDHKLDEWREFCKWITELPYCELIIGDKEIIESNDKEE